VVVTPGVNAKRIEVEIRAWDGLGVAQGRLRWPATARAGVAVSEDLILAVRGTGERRLLITATLVFADGTRLSGVENVLFNPRPRGAVEAPTAGGRAVTTPAGEQLLEIPAL
jgi:hypothetical protein